MPGWEDLKGAIAASCYAIDATRVHLTRPWVVSFSSLSAFRARSRLDLSHTGGSHDAFMMNQRITSETFRFKFLNYNRAWLINQLPSILTPRTLRRSRPYFINQFTRILNQLNQDISSDSEDDGRKFGPVALKANSRQIIRWWLAQARRRMRLREVVQPLISKARGTQCENCLSRRQLQVTCVIPLEVLAAQFDAENADQEFDQARISASCGEVSFTRCRGSFLLSISSEFLRVDRDSVRSARSKARLSWRRVARRRRRLAQRATPPSHAGRLEDLLDQVPEI